MAVTLIDTEKGPVYFYYEIRSNESKGTVLIPMESASDAFSQRNKVLNTLAEYNNSFLVLITEWHNKVGEMIETRETFIAYVE